MFWLCIKRIFPLVPLAQTSGIKLSLVSEQVGFCFTSSTKARNPDVRATGLCTSPVANWPSCIVRVFFSVLTETFTVLADFSCML